jgi:putative endonuclease
MGAHNKEMGIRGEQIAVKYLLSQGYVILERNYRSRQGEIDIVSKHNNTIIFVEVKTRSSLAYGRPVESINHKKIKHLQYTAQGYMQWKNLNNCACRFDAIEVVIGSLGIKPKINHILNII